MKYSIILLALVAAVLTSCGDKGYTLKGAVQGAANLQVVLEQSHLDRSNVAIGKAACDANGAFSITSETPWKEGLYRLTIGAKKLYFILDGKEKTVEIKGDLATLDQMKYEVTGAPTIKCYNDLIAELMAIKTQPTADELRSYVAKGCTPLMKAFIGLQLYGGAPNTYMTELKALGDELGKSTADPKYSKDFNDLLAQVEQQMAQQAAADLIKVGQPAPDISLQGPDGKTHTLSALKGKVVLLDFWASWCGPCRRANPHVVEIYKKYKAKGFDVFSVSLDGVDPRQNLSPEETERRKAEGKVKWVDAIKQDKLEWPNHESDLRHWGSAPAATYGVSAIPKTFLIGKDGNIIAINPGPNLEQELQKAL